MLVFTGGGAAAAAPGESNSQSIPPEYLFFQLHPDTHKPLCGHVFILKTLPAPLVYDMIFF